MTKLALTKTAIGYCFKHKYMKFLPEPDFQLMFNSNWTYGYLAETIIKIIKDHKVEFRNKNDNNMDLLKYLEVKMLEIELKPKKNTKEKQIKKI